MVLFRCTDLIALLGKRLGCCVVVKQECNDSHERKRLRAIPGGRRSIAVIMESRDAVRPAGGGLVMSLRQQTWHHSGLACGCCVQHSHCRLSGCYCGLVSGGVPAVQAYPQWKKILGTESGKSSRSNDFLFLLLHPFTYFITMRRKMQHTPAHPCAYAAHTSAEGVGVTTHQHADSIHICNGNWPHEISGRMLHLSKTPCEMR